MTTDTPRTDAAAIRCACSTYVVPSEFARELERENAALREKVDDWDNAVLHSLDHRPDEKHCTCVPPLIGKVRQLERENATLRAKLIIEEERSIYWRDNERKAMDENAALRKRLEILSKSNEKQTEEYICVDREHGLWKRAARKAQP